MSRSIRNRWGLASLVDLETAFQYMNLYRILAIAPCKDTWSKDSNQRRATRSSSAGTARSDSLGWLGVSQLVTAIKHVSVRQVGHCRTHAKRPSAGSLTMLQGHQHPCLRGRPS
jgi:hypothetical protein